MTTFDEREKAFERKFAHDQDLRFRATARRNKLFGLWAAEKLGLTAPKPANIPKALSWPIFNSPATESFSRTSRAN
jgi:hypothetical protein